MSKHLNIDMGNLILSCKAGSCVYIGTSIRIKVVAADRGKVQLYLSAPRDVLIERDKVRQARLEQESRSGFGREVAGG